MTPEEIPTDAHEALLEPLSEHDQVDNFITVHGMTYAIHTSHTNVRSRLQLMEAFLAAPAQPVDFPAMSGMEEGYSDSGILELSTPYDSTLQHPLVGFDREYSATKWGIFQTCDENPYHIMRLSRLGTGEFPVGETSPRGIYAARPKAGGVVVYFAVMEQPDEGDSGLRVIETLDETLRAAVMHEIMQAAKAMKAYKHPSIYHSPSYVLQILARYPR